MRVLIATRAVAENAAAVLAGFQLRRALLLHGMIYDRDQGRSVSLNSTAALSSWVLSLDARG
jgi:hypothetical protein